MSKVAFFWFRRDLRLADNAGLYHALRSGHPVIPVFILDTQILNKLPAQDARLTFIYDQLLKLKKELLDLGSDLLVEYGDPAEIWKKWITTFDVAAVYTNRDYEPYALIRDKSVERVLNAKSIVLHTFKDQVIFEGNEILKDDGKPYTVFTPYSRKWKSELLKNSKTYQESFYVSSYPSTEYLDNLHNFKAPKLPELTDLGFQRSDIKIPPIEVPGSVIKNYTEKRDYPGQNGTSRLGIHFRFGTISIREKARKAINLSETFLNELIWRDFYSQILFHFPHVVKGAFKPAYDQIEWLQDEDGFKAWCEGRTGYPLVDAGLRELNATGYMHNRVRMITASFLCKHLLIDWRWGEAYFAEKLLDFDLASNNGGWQWAAGSGTDAAPYFRIFNPTAQAQKFDKNNTYIRKWVPELESPAYPKPIVEHKFARERCLKAYKEALKNT